jgi:hypothetical protein
LASGRWRGYDDRLAPAMAVLAPDSEYFGYDA